MKNHLLVLFCLSCTNLVAQTWTNLGSGTNSFAWSMTVHNSEVIVGGQFDTAGGVVCNQLAAWDGINWHTLPGSPSGDNISALESYNGELYMARAVPPFIHKWDNVNWSALGSGTNSVVVDIQPFNSEIYAGGLFTTAGGNPAKHIAKWDGTTWSNVGGGFNNDVLALAVYNGELYASGRFDTIFPFGIAHRIAKWDGVVWVPLGSGITGGNVITMQEYNGELWVGGTFLTAGGISSQGLARWNGSSWSAPPGAFYGGSTCMTLYNNTLCVGGIFSINGGAAINGVGIWDGSTWDTLGSTSGYIAAIAEHNGDIYVSGGFSDFGGINANNVAKFNSPVGMSDEVINEKFIIAPNPVNNFLKISSDQEFLNGEMKIIDGAGRIVTQSLIDDSFEWELNTSSLSNGMYFIEIFAANKLHYNKFIVNH